MLNTWVTGNCSSHANQFQSRESHSLGRVTLADKYVRRIEELIGAPVALASTSPERDDTILAHNPFQD